MMPNEVKVLLLERDGVTRATAKVVMESLDVGVVSARSAGRALDLLATPHLRFDALVLGPSVLDAEVCGLLVRALSRKPALRVLALTVGDRRPAGGSMTPLAICWALERGGCEYSLLDDPWTRPRLRQCLDELLGRAREPAA
jgi:hypothetical protein